MGMSRLFWIWDTSGFVQTIASRNTGKAGLCLVLLLGVAGRTSESNAEMAAGSPRERLSFNADWRFQKGDPAGAEGQLAYPNIKNWVTATGNEFALSPDAAKGTRPDGNLGADIACTQRGFNDSGWRQLNLP